MKIEKLLVIHIKCLIILKELSVLKTVISLDLSKRIVWTKSITLYACKESSIWKKYLITEISERGVAICQPPHIRFMLSKNKFHEYMVFDHLIVDFAK